MKLLGIALALIGLWGVIQLFESDEEYLRKATEELIQLASLETQTDMQTIKRVGKMAEHFHFDIHFEAQVNSKKYEGKHLNNVRSMLFSYFKGQFVTNLKAKNLQVEVQGKTKGASTFDMSFKAQQKSFDCETLLNWIKEKDWFIKEIKVSSCSS